MFLGCAFAGGGGGGGDEIVTVCLCGRSWGGSYYCVACAVCSWIGSVLLTVKDNMDDEAGKRRGNGRKLLRFLRRKSHMKWKIMAEEV